MSTYLRLRAVPAPALRNSPAWLERLFASDAEAARRRADRFREEMLDQCCLDQERIYTGAPPTGPGDRPQAQVVLGGRPVLRTDRRKSPLLVLTAAQARRVAGFLEQADFDALWDVARDGLLPRYGGRTAEPETARAFAVAHRELRAFYAHTAECGDAVVKWRSEACAAPLPGGSGAAATRNLRVSGGGHMAV
ncbi:DUF1877 family protein [Streptomyces sp. NPDC001980]|uniref:DUF1877 family protein n=1 Tax=Streptomyces sp. NPDC001980 TaxID=3157126 RepID=UPI00333243BB